MKKEFLDIDKKQCEDLAQEIFADISGMNRPSSKGRRIRQGGMAMHQKASDSVDIKAQVAYASCQELILDGEQLTVGDVTFNCKAFAQIDPQAIQGVYFYAGCAGDFTAEEESVLNQVYVDLWGSAYTDAMRYVIRDICIKSQSLSESFGPGFYGMPVGEISQIAQLLDFHKLGIRINNKNVMIPVKSCCGLYFAVNDKYQGIGAECAYCRGNGVSCNLCMINNDRMRNHD